MLKTVTGTNIVLYMAMMAGFLGMFCQIILSRKYGQLIRGLTDVASAEKNEFIKQIRFKFRTNRKRSAETTDISVFVNKVLLEYRFVSLSFHQWKRLAAGFSLAGMLMLTGGMLYAYRVSVNIEQIQKMGMAFAGLLACSVLTFLWADLPYKAFHLQIKLEDYLCHSGIASDYQEVEFEAETPQTVTETKAQKEKRELKASLAKMKEGIRETAVVSGQEKERNREILSQMDPREQERIIRDVLAEFLA